MKTLILKLALITSKCHQWKWKITKSYIGQTLISIYFFRFFFIKLLELLLITCLYLIIMASSHFWNLGWTKVNFIVNFILKVYCLIVIAESKTTTCGWRSVLHYIHLSVTGCKGVIKKVGIKSRNSAFSAKTYWFPVVE